MLHTKFRGNPPAGSGEEEFKGFLPCMGMAAILVMCPASCHQIFISLNLKAFIKNLVQIGTVVSEKIRFEFLYVHNLGPRSRNDLDLHYSHEHLKCKDSFTDSQWKCKYRNLDILYRIYILFNFTYKISNILY